MGKFLRKAKVTVGVRTRAKTLALQLFKSSSSSIDSNILSDASEGSCYIELRSRRLRKVSPLNSQQAHENLPKKTTYNPDCESNPPSPVSTLGVNDWMNHDLLRSASVIKPNEDDGYLLSIGDAAAEDDGVMGTEASFGENDLHSEARERVIRDSTLCSFVRDVDVDVVTPGSSTRHTFLTSLNHGGQYAFFRNIPITDEMEEFFTRAELQHQRQFLEKYNFDLFSDMPLPGRWLRV